MARSTGPNTTYERLQLQLLAKQKQASYNAVNFSETKEIDPVSFLTHARKRDMDRDGQKATYARGSPPERARRGLGKPLDARDAEEGHGLTVGTPARGGVLTRPAASG
jgi:hypothetical protein